MHKPEGRRLGLDPGPSLASKKLVLVPYCLDLHVPRAQPKGPAPNTAQSLLCCLSITGKPEGETLVPDLLSSPAHVHGFTWAYFIPPRTRLLAHLPFSCLHRDKGACTIPQVLCRRAMGHQEHPLRKEGACWGAEKAGTSQEVAQQSMWAKGLSPHFLH